MNISKVVSDCKAINLCDNGEYKVYIKTFQKFIEDISDKLSFKDVGKTFLNTLTINDKDLEITDRKNEKVILIGCSISDPSIMKFTHDYEKLNEDERRLLLKNIKKHIIQNKNKISLLTTIFAKLVYDENEQMIEEKYMKIPYHYFIQYFKEV